MSDPEDFLARWSRRKREAAEDAAAATSPAVPVAPVESAHALEDEGKASEARPTERTASDKPAPAFDLARLPSIESITAATDIRAFLAPGVPPELTRAALRRAWAADPTIRDFVGLAENAWDFTAPDAIPGFGPLEMTDELRRQVMRMIGGGLDPDAGDRPEPTAATGQAATIPAETSAELVAGKGVRPTQEVRGVVGTAQDEPVNNNDESAGGDAPIRSGKVHIAMQHSPEKAEDGQLIVRRSHGRALPE